MRGLWRCISAVVVATMFGGCIDYGAPEVERMEWNGAGVFVVNEGNFMYGNASLSYIDLASDGCESNLFMRANGAKLGDVAQSMTIRGDRGYIVVNNSGVIYVIDTSTMAVRSLIGGFVSPRYIHFVSDEKAYVTDLYGGSIAIVNPATNTIVGKISAGEHHSTEQMVEWEGLVFVCCWSGDDSVLVVDSHSDSVVDEIRVGSQPSSVVLDKNGKVWVLSDGGNAVDAEPTLCRIDAATRRVEQTLHFDVGDSPSRLCIDGNGERLFYLNDSVFAMSVDSAVLPDKPLIESRGTIYYGLGVDAVTGEIYLADAVDYVQSGMVYRYSPSGELLSKYGAGINPSSFCFKSSR